MHFQRVKVKFYDSVNMIHDVIRTAYQFSLYTAKFMFVPVRNYKTQQIRLENYQFSQPH